MNRHDPNGLWRRWLRRLRYTADVAAALYLTALVAVLFLLARSGSGLWALEPLRFLPAHGWLLPVIPCGILAILCRRWLWLPALAMATVLVLWPYMGLRFGSGMTHAEGLRIVSNNVGQNNRNSIQDFLDAVEPDVMAYQDAAGRGGRYAKRFADYQVREVGEFVLISKFPILDAGAVRLGDARPAAWFDLDWDGQTIRIYNVHVPTPRKFLSRLYGLGALKEVARPILKPDSEGLRELVRDRYAVLEGLRAAVAESPHPVIVVGDLNLPPYGAGYRDFADGLQDGHLQAGSGWGMTFPGESRNPLTGFGPWLRIDYVWADPSFRFTGFATEADRASQHRAVAAALVRYDH